MGYPLCSPWGSTSVLVAGSDLVVRVPLEGCMWWVIIPHWGRHSIGALRFHTFGLPSIWKREPARALSKASLPFRGQFLTEGGLGLPSLRRGAKNSRLRHRLAGLAVGATACPAAGFVSPPVGQGVTNTRSLTGCAATPRAGEPGRLRYTSRCNHVSLIDKRQSTRGGALEPAYLG